MMKMKRFYALILALCLLLCSCGAPEEKPKQPEENLTEEENKTELPAEIGHKSTYDCSYETELADLSLLADGGKAITRHVDAWPYEHEWVNEKTDILGYDARGCDLSGEDLSGIEDVNDISFSTDTIWPDADKLPEGYDPEKIIELGKDPGLGIRELHKQGITGEGVGIAILDLSLFTEHEQYRDNLTLYEIIHNNLLDQPEMHGAAVSSIAVGRDIGVAPGADLYFISCRDGHWLNDDDFIDDAGIAADAILRVLKINKSLPEGKKIRVISISDSFPSESIGYDTLKQTIKQAKEENVFVITANTKDFYHGFDLMGMGRDCYSDPNDPTVYRQAGWIKGGAPLTDMKRCINVPMGGRTYASMRGESEYEWCSQGGMSWTVPWMAGFYALCCQVKPELTIDEFISVVYDTATVEIKATAVNAKYNSFGKIIDPAAVIAALGA